MDDPWGSPWTISSAPQTVRTPSPTKSDLEPPPRAFLSTTSSPRLPVLLSQSPWADDNEGFGDWAAADAPPTTTQAASGWGGGWGGTISDTSGANGQQYLTTTPQEEGFGFGQASPIAWPGSIAVTSGLKLGNGSVFRQPSPDPWVSEFDDFREASDRHSAPRLVLNQPSEPAAAAHEPEAGTTHEEPASVWDEGGGAGVIPMDTEVVVRHDNDEEAAVLSKTTPPPDVPGAQAGAITPNSPESNSLDQPRLSTDSEPRSCHSRSLSTSRAGSGSDGARQDSPITSIDEDAKSRLALPPRKVSGKIQVLVEKFDGLAKSAVDDHIPIRREREATPQRTDMKDADPQTVDVVDADVGEGAENASAQGAVRSASRGRPTERTPIPDMRPRESPNSYRSRSPRTSQRGPSTTTYTKASPHVAKRASVKFDVDLQQVETLFEDLTLATHASNERSDVSLSDHIITDSFTQISERKAWYRISRQGSSRMHNSGDVDSYRRVAWPSSTIHQETLTIVRRWMEQDSITGRTTLGGGSNKTNMFNWDSAEQPVAIAQVFAKRRGHMHAQPISLQQPLRMPPASTAVAASTTRRPSGTPRSPIQRAVSSADSPGAAFGWSTGQVEEGPCTIQQARALNRPISEQAQGTSVQGANTHPIVPQQPQALDVRPGQIFAPTPRPTQGQEDDDEDEWGEMVSSPVAAAQAGTQNSFKKPDDSAVFASSTTGTSLPPISSNKPYAVVSGRQDAEIRSSVPDLCEQSPRGILPKQPLVDPWAMPDQFSAFDQPRQHITTTIAANSTTAFTPTTPLAILSPLTVSAETPLEQAHTIPCVEDQEGESLVRQIVENLPDLSYMLR